MAYSKNQRVKTKEVYEPPVNSSWKFKALDCLLFYDECVTTIEILGCIIGQNAFDKLTDKEREKHIAVLSVTLSNLVKERYIKKVKIKGLKGNFYGLSHWFTPEGYLMAEYASDTLIYLYERRNKMSCCE